MLSQEQQYYNNEETRSQQQIQKQADIVRKIHERNINLFSIQLTPKQKIAYEPAQLFKLELSDGWYCNITDNYRDKQYKGQFTIFTLHGSPGNHIEWAGLYHQLLKYNKTIRWINFVFPGYDGEDERRGNYKGNFKDFGRLFQKILDKLQIGKAILCGHSMGSICSTYLIKYYSHRICGYINVTGIIDRWYIGMFTFYYTTISRYGYNKDPEKTIQLLKNDQQRKIVHKQFIEGAKQVTFGSVNFPELSITEICAYVKLFSSIPGGFSVMYTWNREMTLPRVLIFGRIDPLHFNHNYVQSSIYNLCFKNHDVQRDKIYKMMKLQLEQIIKQKFNANVKGQKIQEYLCYYFQQTGHNAHKRRTKQLAKILALYLTFLEIKQKYQRIKETKL